MKKYYKQPPTLFLKENIYVLRNRNISKSHTICDNAFLIRVDTTFEYGRVKLKQLPVDYTPVAIIMFKDM